MLHVRLGHRYAWQAAWFVPVVLPWAVFERWQGMYAFQLLVPRLWLFRHLRYVPKDV